MILQSLQKLFPPAVVRVVHLYNCSGEIVLIDKIAFENIELGSELGRESGVEPFCHGFGCRRGQVLFQRSKQMLDYVFSFGRQNACKIPNFLISALGDPAARYYESKFC